MYHWKCFELCKCAILNLNSFYLIVKVIQILLFSVLGDFTIPIAISFYAYPS